MKHRALLLATTALLSQHLYASEFTSTVPDHVPSESTPLADAQAILARLEDAAKQGDPAAENDLGTLYARGAMVPQDFQTAAAWYRKSAAQGYATAEINLGRQYLMGQGVPQDYTQARQWFDEAAAQGQTKAEVFIGAMYALGQGVTQNYTEAYAWFKKAAAKGDATAECNIGSLYAVGWGVPQSNDDAVRWFRTAADHKDPRCQLVVGQAYLLASTPPGDSLLTHMGVPQEAKLIHIDPSPDNTSEGLRLITAAATQGLPMAQTALGLMYADGVGTEKNLTTAELWLLKAAGQGDSDDQVRLGVFYAQRHSSTADLQHAREWLLKAAAQGNAKAEYLLARLYRYGAGVPVDIQTAETWYLKADAAGFVTATYELADMYQQTHHSAAQIIDMLSKAAAAGHPLAQYRLATFYENGSYVLKDTGKAQEWFKRAQPGLLIAAKAGDPEPQYQLGYMYEHGYGVDTDNTEAQKWYALAAPGLRKTADQGNRNSQNLLANMYLKGRGVAVDYAQALGYAKQAAAQGDLAAVDTVGEIYATGYHNNSEAVRWYARAAHGGHKHSIDMLPPQLAQLPTRQTAHSVNLSNAPAADSPAIATLPAATTVWILTPQDSAPPQDWIEVYVEENHQTGWLSTPDLSAATPATVTPPGRTAAVKSEEKTNAATP